MKFIIEHLEPKLYPWCLIEYKHISKIIGKNNLIITNIQKRDFKKLEKYGETKTKSVKDLKLKNACLLNPDAKKELTPKDKFDYYIFGGILGDYPKRNRTSKLLKLNIEKRNLTHEQMATDTAAMAVKLVLKGKKLSEIKFRDKLTITIKNGKYKEETELPYRYILIKNKPVISRELIKYLKESFPMK